MRQFRTVVVCLVLPLALILIGCELPSSVEKQVVDKTQTFTVSGSVAGRVVGADGVPIRGVTVAYNSPARALVTATTNAQGMYEITGLPSGEYEIFIGGGTHTIGRQYFAIDTLSDIVETTLGSLIYSEFGEIVDGQFYVDRFGTYRINYHLPDTIVHPLAATVKGVALLETVDAEFNRVTTVAPVGFTVGVQVKTMGNEQLESLPEPLEGIYTGKVGAAGAFTIEKLPAGFPEPLIYNFFIISSNNATAAVAYKINDEGWHIAGEASNASDFDGFITALRPNETVSTGEVTFKAAIKPVVVAISPDAPASAKFLPGTTGTPTPLSFTFSKAMAPGKGSISVKDNASTPATYICTPAWNTANTILTVTPAIPFEYGKIITVTLAGLESSDGVVMDETTIDFHVRDALTQVYTSWYSPWTNTDVQKVAINASPTITFNYDLTGYTVTATKLLKGTLPVDAEFSVNGNTLEINPAADLHYNTEYTVEYEVTDGVTKLAATAASAPKFTTVKSPTLGTPAIAFDAINKLIEEEALRSTYNGGDSPIYLDLTTVSAINGVLPTYTVEYRKDSDLEWSTGTAADAVPPAWVLSIIDASSTTTYAAISDVSWGSGDEYLFRIRASHAAAPTSTVSNTLRLEDLTAPTAGTIAGTAWSAYIAANNLISATTVNRIVLETELYDGFFSFDVSLASEAIGTITVTPGTLVAADAVLDRITYSTDGMTATVRFRVPKNTTQTYDGKTVLITLRDKAGNLATDYDLATTGTQGSITLTLIEATVPAGP